jgi:hypothetical protein
VASWRLWCVDLHLNKRLEHRLNTATSGIDPAIFPKSSVCLSAQEASDLDKEIALQRQVDEEMWR